MTGRSMLYMSHREMAVAAVLVFRAELHDRLTSGSGQSPGWIDSQSRTSCPRISASC